MDKGEVAGVSKFQSNRIGFDMMWRYMPWDANVEYRLYQKMGFQNLGLVVRRIQGRIGSEVRSLESALAFVVDESDGTVPLEAEASGHLKGLHDP